jgi:hypothetical protein
VTADAIHAAMSEAKAAARRDGFKLREGLELEKKS